MPKRLGNIHSLSLKEQKNTVPNLGENFSKIIFPSIPPSGKKLYLQATLKNTSKLYIVDPLGVDF
jgi:hypothetical protein